MCGDMEIRRTRPLVNDVDLPPSILRYRKSVATLPNRDVFNLSTDRPCQSKKLLLGNDPSRRLSSHSASSSRKQLEER